MKVGKSHGRQSRRRGRSTPSRSEAHSHLSPASLAILREVRGIAPRRGVWFTRVLSESLELEVLEAADGVAEKSAPSASRLVVIARGTPVHFQRHPETGASVMAYVSDVDHMPGKPLAQLNVLRSGVVTFTAYGRRLVYDTY